MVLHFLKQDALIRLKTNVGRNLALYSSSDNSWIQKQAGMEEPFQELKLPVRNFTLATSGAASPGELDFQNAVTLFEALKGLSESQASDERLWAGLCHGDFWGYMQARWGGSTANNRQKDEKKSILLRYFIHTKEVSRRGLIQNTLSKLWWVCKLTYVEGEKDPYYLTRYFEKDFAVKVLILFSNNYTSSQTVLRGLIKALQDLEQDHFTLDTKRDVYYKASQFLNIYGGSHILDYLTADEIHDAVIGYMWGLRGGPSSSAVSRTDNAPESQPEAAAADGGSLEQGGPVPDIADPAPGAGPAEQEHVIQAEHEPDPGQFPAPEASARTAAVEVIGDASGLQTDAASVQPPAGELQRSVQAGSGVERRNMESAAETESSAAAESPDDAPPVQEHSSQTSPETGPEQFLPPEVPHEADDAGKEPSDISDAQIGIDGFFPSPSEQLQGKSADSSGLLLAALRSQGFTCIDRRDNYILWVLYDAGKKDLFEETVRRYQYAWGLEKRGSPQTDRRPAWYVRIRTGGSKWESRRKRT